MQQKNALPTYRPNRVTAVLPIRKCGRRGPEVVVRNFRSTPASRCHRDVLTALTVTRAWWPASFVPGVGWGGIEREPKTKTRRQNSSVDLLISACIPFMQHIFLLLPIYSPDEDKTVRSLTPGRQMTHKSTETISNYPIRKIKQGNVMESDWGQRMLQEDKAVLGGTFELSSK